MPQIQKILVVEDDFYIADIYEAALKEAGYQVLKAADGKAALTAVKKFSPQLILLDIMLPDLDGLAVLKQLRNDPAYKGLHVIVVMVTNLDQSSVADEARQLGADGYIVKANIKPSDLVATVKSYDKVG